MGRKPIGRKAMTDAERKRQQRERARAAKLKRDAAKMEVIARPVIAAVLASGHLAAVSPAPQNGCLTDAKAVLAGLRAAGLSIVRTSSLK